MSFELVEFSSVYRDFCEYVIGKHYLQAIFLSDLFSRDVILFSKSAPYLHPFPVAGLVVGFDSLGRLHYPCEPAQRFFNTHHFFDLCTLPLVKVVNDDIILHHRY